MRIEVLGPVRVWRADGEADLGGAQSRAVLGLLAVAGGRPVSRSVLVDALWGGRPPATAVNVIQTHITRLRRHLEPDHRLHGRGEVVVRTGDGYALEVSGLDLDLIRFRELVDAAATAQQQGDQRRAAALLRDALSLWRGAPLADLPFLAAHPAVAAVGGERRSAVARYGELMVTTGAAAEALALLAEVAAAEPLDEAAQTRLIRAYQAVGRIGDAFATYRATCRRLADDLGVNPGPELEAVHAELLRHGMPAAGVGVGAGVGQPTGAAVAAPDPEPGPSGRGGQLPVPAQLPGDVPGFAGRREHLAQLDSLLTGLAAQAPTAVVVAAVSGTAGVGKTALAVHWAHRVAGGFPDGQLYVNLRGFDPDRQLMAATEALRGFLEALGLGPARIPSTVDAQAALYRSMLAGKRVLVVLDNARDADQVRPLLPGTPTAVTVVTSRDQLVPLVAANGAHPVTLDLLTAAEAGELLVRRLGPERLAAEPAAVRQIVTRCARLPLALTIVAARAATRPAFPLAILAAELDEAGGRLDALAVGDPATEVRAVFSWSYGALSPDAARLFRLLGLHPGRDSSAAAIASLAGRPPPQVRPLLAELARANLIAEPAAGRFTRHDLLRAYATELAHERDPDPDRRAAVTRLLDHYLHTAYSAAQLLSPFRDPIAIGLAAPAAGVTPEHLTDDRQAVAWLSAERPVLLAVLSHAAAAGFDTHTWQLAWTLDLFLDRRGRWQDHAAAWQLALGAANRLAHLPARAHAHRSLAGSHTQLGHGGDAHAHHQLALDLYLQAGDQVGQARTHNNLTLLWERQGRLDKALHHAEESLALYRAAGHQHGEALGLNAVGWYRAAVGDYDQALACCQDALARLQELGDRNGAAVTWDSLGYTHHHLGNLTEALACYQRALDLFGHLGDRPGQAGTLTHLGDTHRAGGDQTAARAAWQHALDILTELDHPDADEIRGKLRGLPEPPPAPRAPSAAAAAADGPARSD